MSAAAEEKLDSTMAPAPSTSGGNGNRIVAIMTMVNMIATIGILGMLFISFQRDRKRPAVEDIVAQSAVSPAEEKGKAKGEDGKEIEGKEGQKKRGIEFGKMVSLEQFTINLSTPGSVNPKFVRVNISLEVPTDDAENEVNLKMPQVRNAIIDLFNSKRPSDLATAEGRDYIKEEIKNALNGFMVSGKVKGVFFTNFALSS